MIYICQLESKLVQLCIVYNRQESESRMAEEKRIQDRKRNLIVLIARYLINMGYFEISSKLQAESNISLDKLDVADNIDLYMILSEFEQYYELKFQKLPKIVKKIDTLEKGHLPKLNSGSGTPNQKDKPPTKNSRKSTTNPSSAKLTQQSSQQEEVQTGQNLEIQGNQVNKQKEQEEPSFFDAKVLKGLPDYSDVPEFQQLASYLQRDIVIENPNIWFKDIAGLEQAKRLIKEAVLVPLKYPHFFQGILEPWKGVLLFGPPGTGKTMLAKAVATECRTTFFNIQASSVVSKWRGDSEKLIRVLFDLARHYEPSTIFIDELDSIMSQRSSSMNEHEGSRRMKTELLIQLDGLMKGKQRVFLLAASNMPWDLDIAMLRRLEKRVTPSTYTYLLSNQILVPLPDLEAREAMLRSYLPPDLSQDLDYRAIAEQLIKYSGSDIKLVCKEAAMKPLRRLLAEIEDVKLTQQQPTKKKAAPIPHNNDQFADVRPGPVTSDDLNEALGSVKPSPSLFIEQYIKWEKDSGSA